jgi:hypothetical protein
MKQVGAGHVDANDFSRRNPMKKTLLLVGWMVLVAAAPAAAEGTARDGLSTASDFDRAKSVMRGWCVDGKTGKFVTRLSGSH